MLSEYGVETELEPLPYAVSLCGRPTATAMEKLRIVTLGISGGRSHTAP
jgi:hypothetical protein